MSQWVVPLGVNVNGIGYRRTNVNTTASENENANATMMSNAISDLSRSTFY